jgi:hypothetical protein
MLDSGQDAKWGWVIYRCTYKPELDRHWQSFKRLIEEETREFIAESDAPELAEELDWVFVENPTLEDASLDELKRRFRAWARAEANYDIDSTPDDRGSRYTYFIQVDEDTLRSLLEYHDPTNPATYVNLYSGFVNIVRGWVDPLPPDEATDGCGGPVNNEDWMHIQASMFVAPFFLFYLDLDNDE